MTVRKIRAKSSTDDGIVEECKEELRCGDCEPICWSTPSKGLQISPPPNTVAVVVDVVRNRGAIRIFEKEGGEYVDGVGTEEEGYRIIVPWQNTWWFRASGVVELGYIKGKDGN